MNNDNESAETTSSGKEFHTVTMRTAKKCCLQLTLDSGKNSLKVCPRVTRLRTMVKKSAGDKETIDHEEFYSIILNQHVIFEALNDRFPSIIA